MKSQAIGFFLTLFFGPFGLLYSSFFYFILGLAAIYFALQNNNPQFLIIAWLASIVISFFTISKYNKNNYKSSSSTQSGEAVTRKFRCSCGSNRYILTNSNHYDRDKYPGSYNYKEWLTCAKCGNRTTNERTLD